MLQGTSMASPQAAGASALLLSAAKQADIDLPPAKLRTALTSTADHIKGVQAYEEGAGLINIPDAWRSIRKGATAHEYSVKAPVDTAIDQFLKTPGHGTGLYDRGGRTEGRGEEDVRDHAHPYLRRGPCDPARAALREQRRAHLPHRRLRRGEAAAERAGDP